MIEVFQLVARVNRDPISIVDESAEPDALARLAPKLLAIAVVGAGIFGAVVGSQRGGIQVAYAAVKMPALLWIPVVLALPAARGLWAACELDVPWARVAMAGLVAMARTAVLAAAMGPVLWLFYSLNPGYHVSVLALAAALALVGLPGLGVVARAMPAGGRRRGLAMAGSLLVLGLCTMQTGWLLRPFVSRPAGEVAFLRAVEEDVFSSLAATSHSAVGDYSQDWKPETRGMLRSRTVEVVDVHDSPVESVVPQRSRTLDPVPPTVPMVDTGDAPGMSLPTTRSGGEVPRRGAVYEALEVPAPTADPVPPASRTVEIVLEEAR